jgi:hypothetical protein
MARTRCKDGPKRSSSMVCPVCRVSTWWSGRGARSRNTDLVVSPQITPTPTPRGPVNPPSPTQNAERERRRLYEFLGLSGQTNPEHRQGLGRATRLIHQVSVFLV